MKGKKGVDNATVANSHVSGAAIFGLSEGANVVTLDGATIDSDLVVNAGDDKVELLNATVVTGAKILNLDGGTNTITP